MNRTTVLLLALALLLAHTLAIYHDPSGGFGPPCDEAHVVYRMARNLVRAGTPSFNPEDAPGESHSALLWIVVAAFAEQTRIPLCQLAGLLCALLTVVALALYSGTRLAGIIAPILLVVSGPIAAAAADGTECALYTLLVTAAFLCFQRRWSTALGALLALAVTTRAEGLLYTAALGLLEAVRRFSAKPQPLRLRSAFAPPLLAALALAVLRWSLERQWMAPSLRGLVEIDATRLALGSRYLWESASVIGTPLLLLPVLAIALRGKLRAQGSEALVLALLALALVGAQGGSSRPFCHALVPALPLAFLSIQEAVIAVIDRSKPLVELLTVSFLALGAGWSALASKLPGDIGPLPTEEPFRAWVTPSRATAQAFRHELGRLGLQAEIRDMRSQRSLGLFLRERLPPGASLLTPWPGALGYLSRRHVQDLLGRATPIPGSDGSRPWTGPARADVLACLSERPDYIVPGISASESIGALEEVADLWLEHYDALAHRPGRRAALLAALADYGPITVPVPAAENATGIAGQPMSLLRHRGLGLGPLLSFERRGEEYAVLVRHTGPPQVVDLAVQFLATDGKAWSLRPTGEFDLQAAADARAEILLKATGTRSIELVRVRIPLEFGPGNLEAHLHNPSGEHGPTVPPICSAPEIRIETEK